MGSLYLLFIFFALFVLLVPVYLNTQSAFKRIEKQLTNGCTKVGG